MISGALSQVGKTERLALGLEGPPAMVRAACLCLLEHWTVFLDGVKGLGYTKRVTSSGNVFPSVICCWPASGSYQHSWLSRVYRFEPDRDLKGLLFFLGAGLVLSYIVVYVARPGLYRNKGCKHVILSY